MLQVLKDCLLRHAIDFIHDPDRMMAFFFGFLLVENVLVFVPNSQDGKLTTETYLHLELDSIIFSQVKAENKSKKMVTIREFCLDKLLCETSINLANQNETCSDSSGSDVQVKLEKFIVDHFGIKLLHSEHFCSNLRDHLGSKHKNRRQTWHIGKGQHLKLDKITNNIAITYVELIKNFLKFAKQIKSEAWKTKLEKHLRFFLLGCLVATSGVEKGANHVALERETGKNNDVIFVAHSSMIKRSVLVAVSFVSLDTKSDHVEHQIPCLAPDFSGNYDRGTVIKIEHMDSDGFNVIPGDQFVVCHKNRHIESILNALDQEDISSMLQEALISLLIYTDRNNMSLHWFMIGQMSTYYNESISSAWSGFCFHDRKNSNDGMTLAITKPKSNQVSSFLTVIITTYNANDRTMNEREVCEAKSLAVELKLKPRMVPQTIYFVSILTEREDDLPITISILPVGMLSSDFRSRTASLKYDGLVVHKLQGSKPCLQCLVLDSAAEVIETLIQSLSIKPTGMQEFFPAFAGYLSMSSTDLFFETNSSTLVIFDSSKHVILHFVDDLEKSTGRPFLDFLVGFMDDYKYIHQNVAIVFIRDVTKSLKQPRGNRYVIRTRLLTIDNKNRYKIAQCIMWLNLSILTPRPLCNIFDDVTDPNNIVTKTQNVQPKLAVNTLVNMTRIFAHSQRLFSTVKNKTDDKTLNTILGYFMGESPENTSKILAHVDDHLYFALLSHSANLTIRKGHTENMTSQRVTYKLVDSDGTNKRQQNPAQVMIWLRSQSEINSVKMGSKCASFKMRQNNTRTFEEVDHFSFDPLPSENTCRQKGANELQSNKAGFSSIISPKQLQLAKICLPRDLPLLYKHGLSQDDSMCLLNWIACKLDKTHEKFLIDSIHAVDIDMMAHHSTKNWSTSYINDTNDNMIIVHFGSDYSTPLLSYYVNRTKCDKIIVQVPCGVKKIRIGTGGAESFVFMLIFSDDESSTMYRLLTFEFTPYACTNSKIVLKEPFQQLTTVHTLYDDEYCRKAHRICFVNMRCLLFCDKSQRAENKWSIWFPADGCMLSVDDDENLVLITNSVAMNATVREIFHRKNIELLRKLNDRHSMFVEEKVLENSSTLLKQVFYLNLNQTLTQISSNMALTVQFIENNPSSELFILNIQMPTVVSIKFNRYENNSSKVRFETINIEMPTNRQLNLIINIDQIREELENQNQKLSLEFNIFKQGHGFTMRLSIKEINLEIGRVKFFGCIDYPGCIDRLRVSVNDRLLHLVPSKSNGFILVNDPVFIDFNTAIFVLSADYSRFPCELKTYFTLGGLSFIRVRDHLIFRNVHVSSVPDHMGNRLSVVLLDFFQFPESFLNIKVIFRSDSVQLMR